MARGTGRDRERVGVSPLARRITAIKEAEDMSYDDLATRAFAERRVKASGELFRKAATDGYGDPLPNDSIVKIAAGLRLSEDEVRELDFERFRPQERRHVAMRDTTADLTDLPTEDLVRLQNEAAQEIARRLAADNPQRRQR